jgi:hypothetical protein
MWRGYFAIEDLNLNASQRQTLIDALRLLGPASHPNPSRLNHWRTRLDNRAAIFEAQFNEVNLTVAKFKDRLANIFGVDPATVDHATQQVSYSDGNNTPVVTFSRGGTNYIRMALFGGTVADWDTSHDEVLGFLAANRGDWEPSG